MFHKSSGPDHPELTATLRGADGHTYDPSRLLNRVARELGMADDATLANALELPKIFLANIRQGKRRVGATVFVRMQELSGIPIAKLKQIMGEKRGRYRVGDD